MVAPLDEPRSGSNRHPKAKPSPLNFAALAVLTQRLAARSGVVPTRSAAADNAPTSVLDKKLLAEIDAALAPLREQLSENGYRQARAVVYTLLKLIDERMAQHNEG